MDKKLQGGIDGRSAEVSTGKIYVYVNTHKQTLLAYMCLCAYVNVPAGEKLM